MTLLHGFELLREDRVPELNVFCQYYRHAKTGAELLSLQNEDENKVFGINFRTPNADSTGIAHIMEHSVLCGSRKYPVKEPFVELMKGSLNTFLNAFTFPDKTCYPVASQNVQDFYNLIEVYLDAVFYPLIPEHILHQEGWHFELESLDGPLTIKGVVYNEMKGNYSSPNSMMAEYTQRAVFPDNVYQYDSGGDPQVIPDLTYVQFQWFHEKMYHPSNARIYFYGDDDPEERLHIMDRWLQGMDRLEVNSQVPLQSRYSAPREFRYGYDAGEDAAKKSMVTLSWLLHETMDREKAFAWGILEHILVGTPASPLRKALVDSGLGEDMIGGGLEDQLRQMAFSTGLKGIHLEDAEKVEKLILDTLGTLAAKGIDPAAIEASLNTIEFRLRENNTGSFPRGLLLMLRVLSTWNYGGDPIEELYFEAPLQAIRGAGLGYFENLIQRDLLENPHRATVIMFPDAEAKARTEALEQKRITDARAQMTEADLQAIIESTARLKHIQETTDSAEALASLPALKLTDLEPKIKYIPQDNYSLSGVPVLFHDLFTNGILYLDVAFDLHPLAQELLPYVPLFCRALVELGTEKEDYVRLIQRIGSKTGGVSATRLVAAIQDSPETAAWLVLRGKGTLNQVEDLLAIMKDILLTGKLDDQNRFRQMVLESKARLESGLVNSGNMVVASRLRAHFHESDWVGEVMGGVEQLFFLRQLIQKIDEDWPAVLEKLEAIRKAVLVRGLERNMVCNVTVDRAGWNIFQDRFAAFLADLPKGSAPKTTWIPTPFPTSEGLTIPSQVNFVGKGAALYQAGYEFDGAHMVVRRYLGTTYLWEKVRVQGGAYGGSSAFDLGTGTFCYLSYRDPNLIRTLENYDGAGDFLKNGNVSQDELVKTIIGTIGMLDAYMLPDAKGFTSMVRTLTGVTDEQRQEIRTEVLTATPEDFQQFGRILDAVKDSNHVVVLGSAEAIQAARQDKYLAQNAEGMAITPVL